MDIIKVFIIILLLIALACPAYAAQIYTSEEVDELILNISDTFDSGLADVKEKLSAFEDEVYGEIEDIEEKLESIEEGNYGNMTELQNAVEDLKLKLEMIEDKVVTPLAITPKTLYSQEDKEVELYVFTNNDAKCRYSTASADYDTMENSFSITGGNKHRAVVDAEEGLNIFFVSCMDYGNQTDDQIVLFKIDTAEEFDSGLPLYSSETALNDDSIAAESEEKEEGGMSDITGRFFSGSSKTGPAVAIVVIILLVSIAVGGYYKIFKSPDDKDRLTFNFKR